MKIAVIGHGYVGQAVERFFKDHFEVVVYDTKYDNADKDAVNDCDLGIVCVPTPMGEDGSCDLSIIHDTLTWLETPLILIKSTIPPTTTKRLVEKYDKNICFSPEYIGEGKYVIPLGKGYPDPTDMKKHEFVIIGGEKAQEIGEYFKTVLGAETTYRFVDSTTAELCKYMENSFLATKVTFCNEFYNIAEAFGVDYDVLRELWLLDGRIGRSHTVVFKNNRGYSGKCLPKDVNAIIKKTEAMGYEPKLLKAVIQTNEEIKK